MKLRVALVTIVLASGGPRAVEALCVGGPTTPQTPRYWDTIACHSERSRNTMKPSRGCVVFRKFIRGNPKVHRKLTR